MFDPAVFAARRDAYMQAIGPSGVAVVRSLPERLRNGDSYHPFRQISDLVYLTGFVEPETTLILRPGAESERVVMFVRPRDPEMEVWDGRRAGIEGAKSIYGADAAYPASELPAKLGELIANREELHYAVGLDDEMDRLVMTAIAKLRKTEKRGKRPPHAIVDPRVALHELRLHKRPEELAALRKAAEISTEAHVLAMRAGKPGVFEHELEALINYTFRRHGGAGPGYATIVGAGANATILHYIENRCAIAAGVRNVHARPAPGLPDRARHPDRSGRDGEARDHNRRHPQPLRAAADRGHDRARSARRHGRRSGRRPQLPQVLHARHLALARPRRPRRRRVHARGQAAAARARYGDHRRARALHRGRRSGCPGRAARHRRTHRRRCRGDRDRARGAHRRVSQEDRRHRSRLPRLRKTTSF
jgi:hypothetical protein